MRGHSKWRNGRPAALLFAATIVLPSLGLALLAYRALDSDRQLAEQLWRERLQDSSRRAYALLEQRVLAARSRAETLARGEERRASILDGIIAVVLSQEIKLYPSSAFAWLPDGRAPALPLPPEMEHAEIRELRLSDPAQAITIYTDLLQRAPARWRGWIHLRLARAYSRAGAPAKSTAALRQAALLPDSPGPVPTRFAARFELAAASPESAAQLYRDLNNGLWTLEKAPYAFYEMRLREWAAGRIPPGTLAAEQQRQAMSNLLERVVHGASGWLTTGPVSALIATSSHARAAATITPESRWQYWVAEAAREMPRDLIVQMGVAPPNSVYPLSLAALGLPGSVWSVPRDPAAPAHSNQSRGRLLRAILILVAGVLVFGSFATARLVRRELRIAQLQSDFAATVSHEFRSPLTGIRQLGEMLLAGRASGHSAADEARRRQYYELICRESDRLTRLVENVLDFSRIEDGRKQYQFCRIDTAEWLRGLAGVAEQRRCVDTVLPAGLPAVEGDREALSSAVLNLLDNAIKYSPDGAAVGLLASREDGWVTIEVRDRGCGIAPEEQRRIFDRFYRGSNISGGAATGVGLGLALVKRIADAHGARIRVESAPGHGSSFYLSLKVTA